MRLKSFIVSAAVVSFCMIMVWNQFKIHSAQLEWYSSPDQDVSLISDGLSFNSGIPPVQAIHPGWGVVWGIATYLRVVHWFGYPVHNLEEFRAQSDLMAAWPALKGHGKFFSFIVCLLIGGLAGMVAHRISQDHLIGCMTFTVFLMFHGFIVQAMLVRSEPVSCFFGLLSLALALDSLAAKSPGRRDLAVCASGAAAMLAVFTKLHALPYLALSFALCILPTLARPSLANTNGLNFLARKRGCGWLRGDELAMTVLLLTLALVTSSAGAKKFALYTLIGTLSLVILRRTRRKMPSSDWIAKLFYFITGVVVASPLVYLSLLPLNSPARGHFWRDLMNSATGLGYALKTYHTHSTPLEIISDAWLTINTFYLHTYTVIFLIFATSLLVALWKRSWRDLIPSGMAMIGFAYCVFAVIRYASTVYWIYYDIFFALAAGLAIHHLAQRLCPKNNVMQRVLKTTLFGLILWDLTRPSIQSMNLAITNSDGCADIYSSEYHEVSSSYDFGRYEVKRYFACPDCTKEFNQVTQDRYGTLENFYAQLAKAPRWTHLPFE